MININVPSVTQGLHKGLEHLYYHGKQSESRNGPVLVGPWPVLTTYLFPANRVLTSPLRDANPFFHVMEALWMLAGRNDLEWPLQFNKRFKEYSDDGISIHGAYGHRWRSHFGTDQLQVIAKTLRENPLDRRCVLAMWDPHVDLGRDGRDFPCNTHAYFDARAGKLDLTVCCRSNDIWWGCYGANAVHFSFLLEYMAAATGLTMGVYRQLSNNFHLYPEIVGFSAKPHRGEDPRYAELFVDTWEQDLYTTPTGVRQRHAAEAGNIAGLIPLVGLPLNGGDIRMQEFDYELSNFMNYPSIDWPYHNEFFPKVAQPMYRAWAAWKNKDYGTAFDQAHAIGAFDWRIACVQWLERRRAKTLMEK